MWESRMRREKPTNFEGVMPNSGIIVFDIVYHLHHEIVFVILSYLSVSIVYCMVFCMVFWNNDYQPLLTFFFKAFAHVSKLLSQCKFDLLEELVAKEVKYTFNFPLKINVVFSCNRIIYVTLT